MKIKGLATSLLIPFVLYTAYTMSVAEQSLLSFGYQLITSPDTAQVLIDLYIMAILAIVWIYNDAKQLNKTAMYWLPFALLTLVFVSIGPLLYLALRKNVRANEK
ncbi:DUF2834 domain-containing protein [Paraglaciecola sp. MB-3u-78]|uniref:DUF2834 domain-containing protein n=1 Tax=Paraglaciecola sp. MB-3u-78 TaxID=2058332 RepID=UPI000C320065|nr:DUF2834 domain-containing protein [Paraglaciecola sp. MB-3u-78]PKG97058.1 DUF2834 domain-containing protein [Paraglaciecola sp. MB-3u-78]